MKIERMRIHFFRDVFFVHNDRKRVLSVASLHYTIQSDVKSVKPFWSTDLFFFFVPPVELEQEIRELTKQKAEQQSALDEWKVGIVKPCGR